MRAAVVAAVLAVAAGVGTGVVVAGPRIVEGAGQAVDEAMDEFVDEDRAVAVLLPGSPEDPASRFDAEVFESTLVEHSDLDPLGWLDVEVRYRYAEDDPERQVQQVAEAYGDDLDLVLVAAVDGAALESAVRAVRRDGLGLMVLAYDESVPGASYYVGPAEGSQQEVTADMLSASAAKAVTDLLTYSLETYSSRDGVPWIPVH